MDSINLSKIIFLQHIRIKMDSINFRLGLDLLRIWLNLKLKDITLLIEL